MNCNNINLEFKNKRKHFLFPVKLLPEIEKLIVVSREETKGVFRK